MTKNFLSKACVLLLAASLTWSCSDDDKKLEDKLEYGWSETMAGNDPTERLWPDFSENYWEYTLDVEKYPNVGLRFKGQFPDPKKDARFFNLTLYNDQTTARLTSIEDFNVIPNEGNKNPFDTDEATGNNFFEINVIPSKTVATVKSGLKNIIVFDEKDKTVKRLSMLLRIYFNSADHGTDFAGVALPEITFFDITTGEDLGKAVRAKSQYYEQAENILGNLPTVPDMPFLMFTLAPDIAYSNGPTGYVTGVNRLKVAEDKAVVFRFIPPHHPASTAENRTADVRYWSVCVGEMTDTYTKVTLPDHKIIKGDKVGDDTYVNFIMIEKTAPNYDEVKRLAAERKINFIEWDTKANDESFMIFHRQMHINPDFEYSVKDKLKSYPELDENGRPNVNTPLDPTKHVAGYVLGSHGPHGKKITIEDFLKADFNVTTMR